MWELRTDLQLHFLYSCVGTLLLAIITNPVIGAWLMFLIGFAKEANDEVFDWKDMGFNIAGILFGFLLINLL